MDPFADIDLDAAAVWLDGAWYTREALVRRIMKMIEAGDFRVSRPSQALERLQAALAASQVIEVRMPAPLAASVEATAARLERPVGHLIREAIAYYLAAAEAYVAQAEAAAAQGEAYAAQGDAAAEEASTLGREVAPETALVDASAPPALSSSPLAVSAQSENAPRPAISSSPPAERGEGPGEGEAAAAEAPAPGGAAGEDEPSS